MDYIDKLSDKEKEWLNSFISETVVTNFKHRGKTLINSKKKRRELYSENNKRNADVYSVSKATHNLFFNGGKFKETGKSSFYEDQDITANAADQYEDAVIRAIGLKNNGLEEGHE